MEIGFIGLGIMGAPMAGHLIANGHTLHLHSLEGVPDHLVAAGGRRHETPSEVTRAAEVVITMLPDTPEVEAVLFGANGVADALVPGKLVIDMSSISPTETRKFAARIAAKGCDYLDAPVSGGEAGAKNAALSIMVGGPRAAFDRARPLFDCIGKTVILVGANNGDGQTAKCANQIVVALTIQAAAEGLLFAARAGTDVQKVREAILGGLGYSRILETHGERMQKASFAPGFRIRLHQKDLKNALGAARDMQLPLPATALAQDMFTAAAAHGAIDLDHAALIQGLEALAGFNISQSKG